MRNLAIYATLFGLVFAAVPSLYAQDSCLASVCGIGQSAINAYPYPNVKPLEIDEELLYDRDYRQLKIYGDDL